jgi:RNA polymerase-binding transcription factor DksA
MDDIKPVFVSNDYRSGFLLRIKRVNGKVVSTWLELSDHNERLETTLKSLDNVLESMKLKNEINMTSTQPANNDYRYYCMVCGDNIPAFKEQPDKQKLYCRKCDRWQMFEKRLRPRN